MLIDILYLVLVLSLLIFLIWSSIYTISLIFSWFRGAPYVATRDNDLNRIMNTIKPQKNSFFLELGCGDGRVLRYAARRYGVIGEGIDINPVVLLKAQILTALQDLKNVRFKRSDVKAADTWKADYIYIFLFPKLVATLQRKLLEETKDNAIIIAHGFQIPFLRKYLDKELEGHKFKTYIYKMTRARV